MTHTFILVVRSRTCFLNALDRESRKEKADWVVTAIFLMYVGGTGSEEHQRGRTNP